MVWVMNECIKTKSVIIGCGRCSVFSDTVAIPGWEKYCSEQLGILFVQKHASYNT